MNLHCTHCNQNLPSEDATATHCRFCRAPLPHGEAAANHQAMMRNFMANAGAQAPNYAPSAYGAPVAYAQGPVVFGGMAHAANMSAMIGKTVDRSMKMGMWITVATLGATFLITGVMLIAMMVR